MLSTAEKEQVQGALTGALRDGKPRVAFNDRPDKMLYPLDLHFFSSAAEAERFCDEANLDFDFAEQVFNWSHYIYLSAETLKASLDIDFRRSLRIEVDLREIARQMVAQHLYLPAGKRVDDLEASLAAGLYFPVNWLRQIVPHKEMADCQVIAHRHEAGQVYEIGRITRVLETFPNYQDARASMDHAVLYNELFDMAQDYVLVGRFHEKAFEVDMEAHALPHSGLRLDAAYHNHEHGHDHYNAHSVFNPATLSLYFFARLRDGKLKLFNDKLQPTETSAVQQAFYPVYYNHNNLTLKI